VRYTSLLAVHRPRPPRPHPAPYTTLFRSRTSPSGSSDRSPAVRERRPADCCGPGPPPGPTAAPRRGSRSGRSTTTRPTRWPHAGRSPGTPARAPRGRSTTGTASGPSTPRSRPWPPGGKPWGGKPPRVRRRSSPTSSSRCPHNRPRTRLYIETSEEHTSELQSRENLVCRLLLEKKKKENTKKSTQLH